MSDQQQDDAAAAAAARAKAEAVLRVAEQAHPSSSYTSGSPSRASGGGGGNSKPAAMAAINQELNAKNQAFKSALSKAGESFRVASDKAGESIRVASDRAGESIRVATNRLEAGIDSIESSIDNVLSASPNAATGANAPSFKAEGAAATTEASSPSADSASAEVIDSKILADVATLSEKIKLCHSMLSSPSLQTPADVDKDETLLAVIGFLEACSPRMVLLIEEGMAGSLGSDALEKCLVVNDALRITLADCDDPSKVTSSTRGSIETTGGQPSLHSESSTDGAEDANDEDDIPGELTAVSARTASERLMDDLLDLDVKDDKLQSSGGGEEAAMEIGGDVGGGKTSGLGDS